MSTQTSKKNFYFYINKQFLDEATDHKILTKAEHDELAKRLIEARESGDEDAYKHLQREFVKYNMRYILNEVSKYNLPVDKAQDAVNIAVMGFMKALDNFDGSTKITTYATFWIKQHIQRYIFHDNLVYFPHYKYEKGLKPLAHVELDAPQWDSEKSLELPDESPGVEELIATVEDKEQVEELLEVLDDREREVIRARFGFEDEERLSLKAVADRFGVTKERIRQIQDMAIAKMKEAATSPERRLSMVRNKREWWEYPERQVRNSESIKPLCEICHEKIVKGQGYYQRSSTRAAHSRCVIQKPAPESNGKEHVEEKNNVLDIKPVVKSKEETTRMDAIVLLLQKLPDFDPSWEPEVQREWLGIYKRMFDKISNP